MIAQIGISAYASKEDETHKSGRHGTEETDKDEASQRVVVLLRAEQPVCDRTEAANT